METKTVTIKEVSQAINLLATNFMESNEIDTELLEVVTKGITSEKGLALRDYVLGMPEDFGIGFMTNFAEALLERTPEESSYAIKTILACFYYEGLEINKAKKCLAEVMDKNPTYPLATLLKRVFDSGWSPESFFNLRKELHPKVIVSIKERASEEI